MKPLSIAFLAASPASDLLPPEIVKPRYRKREHASPWVRALSSALSERPDCTVEVFVHSRAVTRAQTVKYGRVRYRFIPKREPLRTDPFHGFRPGAVALRPALEAFDPDIVHAFGLESGYGQIAARLPWPRVVFIQGIVERYRPWRAMNLWRYAAFERAERRALQRMQGAVAETTFAKTWAQQTAPQVPVFVIPHAVCPAFFDVQPDFRSRTAVWIGSLDSRKAPLTAIDAFSRCAHPSWRLLIIGDGPQRRTCEDRCKALGLNDAVCFTGSLSRACMLRELSRAACLFFTSRMDVSPNVITEAHAAGLPVVASRVGGVPEMIDDGADGRLTAVDDASGMAHALEEVLGNPKRCKEWGLQGRQKVSSLNAPERIAAEHMRMYRSILSGDSES